MSSTNSVGEQNCSAEKTETKVWLLDTMIDRGSGIKSTVEERRQDFCLTAYRCYYHVVEKET